MAVEQWHGAKRGGYAALHRTMLAKGLDWPQSRINNYANANWGRSIGVESALVLASVIGVSAAYLLCVDEESTLTSSEKELLSLYRQTDSRGRSTILAAARENAGYTEDGRPLPDGPPAQNQV